MSRANRKNSLFPRVKRVKHLRAHKLEITFSNGEVAAIDFKPYVVGRGGIMKPLEKVEFFKRVRVDPDFKTLVWPNDADWCPDVLYWMATGRPITWSTDPKYHEPPPHLKKQPNRLKKRSTHRVAKAT